MISKSRSEHLPGIELQVLPTPQLVKRGEDLTFTGPMEAGMVVDFLWFQATFVQFLVVIQVLETG